MNFHLGAVTLAVLDLERSRAFYADVLGLAARPSPPQRPTFALGSTVLALRPRELLLDETGAKAGRALRPRDVFPGFTLTHVAPSQADVDRLLADVAARGGRVVRFPERASGGRYAGYFADPDGYLWEVACGAALVPSEPADERAPAAGSRP